MSQRPAFFRALIAVFGGTLIVQLLAFVRQIAFASFFGADRSVDIYVLVVAIASLTVFVFNLVIENASIPALVERRNRSDPDAFRSLATRLFSASTMAGVALCAVFLVFVQLMSPIVGAGLTPQDRAQLGPIAWYLVPWVLCVLPFYALSAIHKAKSNYARFLSAEILVVLVSLIVLFVWHPTVETTALAFGAGYLIGILALLPGSHVRLVPVSWRDAEVAVLLKPILQLTGATTIASLGSLADRFIQSYLPAGGIAASTYSSLLVSSTSTLLGFRDVFLVPFSEPADRAIKLERALIGLALLAIPAGAILSLKATEIVTLLFERGRFSNLATAQTAQLLQIQAFSLLSGALGSPMFRMLQVIDRIHLGSVVFAISGVCTFVFGAIFVLLLEWGLQGYAIAILLVSYATMGASAVCVWQAGIRIDVLRLLRYIGYAVVVAVLASAATALSPRTPWPFLTLALESGLFGCVIALGYGIIYKRLLWIIRQT